MLPHLIIGQRNCPLVYWDAQNLAPSVADVEEYDDCLVRAVRQFVPQWENSLFKAWVSPGNKEVVKALRQREWTVKVAPDNCDTALIHAARSDAGQDPERTAVFIVSRDGDYVDLIRKLQEREVAVYLIAPRDASRSLVNAVGSANWIRL